MSTSMSFTELRAFAKREYGVTGRTSSIIHARVRAAQNQRKCGEHKLLITVHGLGEGEQSSQQSSSGEISNITVQRRTTQYQNKKDLVREIHDYLLLDQENVVLLGPVKSTKDAVSQIIFQNTRTLSPQPGSILVDDNNKQLHVPDVDIEMVKHTQPSPIHRVHFIITDAADSGQYRLVKHVHPRLADFIHRRRQEKADHGIVTGGSAPADFYNPQQTTTQYQNQYQTRTQPTIQYQTQESVAWTWWDFFDFFLFLFDIVFLVLYVGLVIFGFGLALLTGQPDLLVGGFGGPPRLSYTSRYWY